MEQWRALRGWEMSRQRLALRGCMREECEGPWKIRL